VHASHQNLGDGGHFASNSRKEAGGLILRVLDTDLAFRRRPSRTALALQRQNLDLQLLYGMMLYEYGRSHEGGASVTTNIPFTLCTTSAVTYAVHGNAA